MRELFLGLDLGGTKTAAGVVAVDGTLVARTEVPTLRLREGGDPLSRLITLGREALEAAGFTAVSGVGVALPGPADHRELRMLAAPTIPELEGLPLRGPLEAAFGCPAAGDNDANACALAEARLGAGRGHAHVVYVTVSTGIGGGIVVDGALFRGSGSTSAEFGHQVILPAGGPPCNCGGTGCLEALASGRGIARRWQEALGNGDGEGNTSDGRDAVSCAERAREGDRVALAVWRDTALYLGAGLSNIINILDPEVVVLGGGVAVGAADLLLDPVREVVARRCMPCLKRGTPIRIAQLGADTGIVGAACLAMHLGAAGRAPG